MRIDLWEQDPPGGLELPSHLLNAVGAVRDEDDQVGEVHLIDGALERLDHEMGKVGEESDGICDQYLFAFSIHSPSGGGESGEKAILHQGPLRREGVEQSGLSCIGVASYRYEIETFLSSLFPFITMVRLQSPKFIIDPTKLPTNKLIVSIGLVLTSTQEAWVLSALGIMDPFSEEGDLIYELRTMDLELCLPGECPGGENV